MKKDICLLPITTNVANFIYVLLLQYYKTTMANKKTLSNGWKLMWISAIIAFGGQVLMLILGLIVDTITNNPSIEWSIALSWVWGVIAWPIAFIIMLAGGVIMVVAFCQNNVEEKEKKKKK